jgi:DNA-binding transcriptional MerR regulator
MEVLSMAFTVKELAELAHVSRRTLHYYDEIGLLVPTRDEHNGYRSYETADAFRLQQILFYRELGFELDQIKAILDEPEFDRLGALESHRRGLEARASRLDGLIRTVDKTISHLKGQTKMSIDEAFAAFTPEQQAAWEEEAKELYGDEEVVASTKLWNSYSDAKKQQVMNEGKAVYADLLEVMDEGPESPPVQAIIARWHQHLRYFYEPSVERLRGLGEMYVANPDFAGMYRKMHPDMPEFLRDAIRHYAKGLTTNTD